uniref:EGF-like domain-containing protein n=1 Tax=Gouania willdenowi TaxID=441366 RepID=A0A8C5HUC1_GOUWI
TRERVVDDNTRRLRFWTSLIFSDLKLLLFSCSLSRGGPSSWISSGSEPSHPTGPIRFCSVDVDQCPDDCSDQGRCVGGRCVCFSGFTGTDCSETSCPGSCTSRGRCVGGVCVCGEGFTGLDCSQTVCPSECSSNGHCVDGQCVCGRGFTGTDCSETSCPGSCTSRGRCVGGVCVCSEGFTGLDCSQCEEGRSGEDCQSGETPTILSVDVLFLFLFLCK